MACYRLPDGKVIRSGAAYVRAWRKLAEPIERLMDWEAVGYDPDVLFRRPGGSMVDLPPDLCRKIGELIKVKP